MAVRIGLERLLSEELHLIRGSRVGLVASASSVDSNLVSSVERLRQCEAVRLVALFGPEHGIHGEAQAGDEVSSAVDIRTGLPVYSLYGQTRKPTKEMLEDLDVLIFDLQDAGVRFYTYLSTLVYVLQAAAMYGLRVVIVDRPNPITGTILEGETLETAFASFVGVYPIPSRHGMTVGEIATYFNKVHAIGCEISVVSMYNWQRDMWYDQTQLPFIPPSPNIPTLATLTVYPGTCLIEGTNLSEGRGTTKPFEYIGAPWLNAESLCSKMRSLNLPGVLFRPVYFTPTFSKYAGQQCAGIHLYVTDRNTFRPIETTIHLLAQVLEQHPHQFEFLPPHKDSTQRHFDLLAGSDQLHNYLTTGKPISDLLTAWESDINEFSSQWARFLLYE